MTTLFVSDIHLTGLQPAITAQFAAFLRGEARQARQLYILGDLFEFWVGDDDPDPTYLQIQSELRALTQAGVACYVMHGNRDFLLGKTFCANTGCQLIADGTVIELFGQRIVLCHGDILCTDDVSYQRLRRIVRNPVIQTLLRLLPLKQRERLASRMRMGSQKHTQQVPESIMDVNEQAVVSYMQNKQVQWLIHGHTHRPGIHQHALGKDTGTRLVLGDWHAQGSVLRWSETGYQLVTLPRP